MYADDLLVCGKANVQEASTISNILNEFCHASRQVPNWNKSAILFSKNVTMQVKQDIKQIFEVPDLDSSTMHLGHPLILPAKKSDMLPTILFMINSKKKRPTKLTDSHMQQGLHLLNLSSPLYLSIICHILFSKKFITKLTAIIRNFWWTGVKDDSTTKSYPLGHGLTFALRRKLVE
jgi:hypothetical protein